MLRNFIKRSSRQYKQLFQYVFPKKRNKKHVIIAVTILYRELEGFRRLLTLIFCNSN